MQLETVINKLLRYISRRTDELSVAVTSGGIDSMEKYKSSRLVSKEQKLWVRARWLAYLRKVKKQLGKEEKNNATRNSD